MDINYAKNVSIREITRAGVQSQTVFESILSRGFTFIICLTGQIGIVYEDGDNKREITLCHGEASLLLGLKRIEMIIVENGTHAYTVHFDTIFVFSSILRSVYAPKEIGRLFKRDHRNLKQLLFKAVALPNINDIVSIIEMMLNAIESSYPFDYLEVLCEAFIMSVENTILKCAIVTDEQINDITLRFLLMVIADFDRSRSVEQYAHELEISKSKLNEALYKQTGYTASKLIDKITAEKIYSLQRIGICNTEIANELRFSNLSNMKRFLSKVSQIDSTNLI